MNRFRTQVDNNGRILIPSQIRKQLSIKSGDVFVIRIVDGEIRIISLNKVITDAQRLIRKYVPKDTSLVGELIKERKEDLSKQED